MSTATRGGEIVIRYTGEPRPPKGHFHGWVWPMPIYEEEWPVISDGFNRHQSESHRQHLGVDVMYKNAHERIQKLPEQTKWYHCGNQIPMLAMGPGHVWFAGRTDRGWTVKLEHHDWAGFPLVTYYTHLSKLAIPEWYDGDALNGIGKAGGIYVPAGATLGIVGNSPLGPDPNHGHVELWDYSGDVGQGRVNRAMAPEPYLREFAYRVCLP